MTTKQSQDRLKLLKETKLFTAVITPLHLDGSVDFESFEALLREQEKAQNGVVILGSTGEGLNIKKSDALSILRFASSLKLSNAVMTGLPGSNLEETLSYLNELNSLPIDAYLVVTPLYAKPGEEGQYAWFKSILDRAGKPCMLYNVPGRTAVKMHPSAAQRLNHHPNFWALKEASGSLADFKKFKSVLPNQALYSGDDGLMNDFATLGACGLVSVASNVWPVETHRYVDACLEHKLSPEEDVMWKKACDALFYQAANPVPVKKLMYLKKKIKTPVLKAPLSHYDLSDHEKILAGHEAVTTWFQNK